MGYSKQAFIGISWVASLRFTTRLLTLLRISILARIFTPSQFGFYGVASLTLSLIEIMAETGINIFLVQKKDDAKRYINTAWIISIARGTIIAIIILLLSPLIVSFFNMSEYLHLLVIIAIVPFVKGFINPAMIFYQKDLRFKNEFYFRFSIFLIESLFIIFAALITREIYSIALGMIVGALAEVVLSFKLIAPQPSFKYDLGFVKEVLHRGKWVTASSIFNYLFHNSDDMIVGKILGISNLGLYQMAYKISIFPITEISDVVSKVVFPVYARIDNDRARLKRAFFKTLTLISVLSISLGVFLFIFAREVIFLVLGESWIDILPFLKILIIFGIIRGISGSTSALFFALNKQEYVSVVTFVSFMVLIVTIFPLTLTFGLIGVSISVLISSVAALPFMAYYTFKVLYE